jgi:hypothetical protein
MLIPYIGNAQELWAGGSLKIDLKKGFSAEMASQVRAAQGLSKYNGYYGEAGLAYKINKYLELGGKYRYTNKAGHHDSEIRPINNRERLTADLTVDFGKSLAFKNRIRYQYVKERNTDNKYNYIRNKASLKYSLHKLAEPYIEGELFYRLDQKNELRAFRYTTGLDSNINKHLSVKNFFRVEKEINTNFPGKYYIFGIMFTYEL